MDLTTIPGIDVLTAHTLLAEIDANLRGIKRSQTTGCGDGQAGGNLVKYRCMYPKPRWNSNEDHEADLRRLREKYPNTFEYCPISHDDFVKEAATDYVIFDYASREPRAIVRTPVAVSTITGSTSRQALHPRSKSVLQHSGIARLGAADRLT